MAPQRSTARLPGLHLPQWAVWWLTISAVLATWDALGSLLRPWTMEGQPLFWGWMPYKMYGEVDLIYSDQRWQGGDRFCEAQSVCNLVEVALQLLALQLWRQRQPSGVLVALLTQTLTFWKTVLYWLYDILGGMAHTGHNNILTWIFIYGILNSLWIIVPFILILKLAVQFLQLIDSTAPEPTKRA